jgi:hypothetical protein
MGGTREGPSYEESLEDFYRAFDKVRGDAGFFENITSGFGAGLVGTGEMAALGAASLLEEESELAAREKIKSVADSLRPEGGNPDDISYLVSSGLGSIVGTLAPAAAAAALPVSAPVAGGIGLLGAGTIGIGAGAGAGEASERARAADATEEERNLATLRGAGIGVLEILPLGRILKIPGVSKLAEQVGGKSVEEGGSRIRSALTTGGAEAAQEAAAGFLQNLNERGYNPERELFDAGLIDEAIAGGGAGAIIQAVVDTFTKGRVKGRPAVPEEGSPDLTDVELLQTIDEEGLSPTGVPSEPRKPLTEAELLQTIDEEGLSEKPVRDFTGTELLEIIDEEGLSDTGVRPKPSEPRKPLTQAELLQTIDEEGLSERPPKSFEQLTDTELLQTINEEGLSDTGIASPPPPRSESRKPLTRAELLQTIDEEGLLQYGDSEFRGSVRDDLLSILDTEPTGTKPIDTEPTDTLADFSQDDIRSAVDTLTARGVEPSAVTEDAVRAELVETKAREAEALETIDEIPEFSQPDLFTSELREARDADLAAKQAEVEPETAPVADAPPTSEEPPPVQVEAEFAESDAASVDTAEAELVSDDVANTLAAEAAADVAKASKRKGAEDAGPDRRSEPDAGGEGVPSDTQAVGQGGVPAGSAETPEGTAESETRSVGDTGVSTGGSAGGKGGKSATVKTTKKKAVRGRATETKEETRDATATTRKKKTTKKKAATKKVRGRKATATQEKTRDATETSTKKTTSRATFRYIPSLGGMELWPIGPRREEGRTPGTLELHTKRAVAIKDLWESRKGKNAVLAREYVNKLMEGPGFAIAEDVTTAGDLLAVLGLLKTAAESPSAKAAKIYFGKLPRPIDALNFMAFDNAFTFEKARNTNYKRDEYELPSGETEGVSDAEAAFYKSLGSKNSELATEWVKANLSETTNKWLLEKQNEYYRSAGFQQYNTTLPDQVAQKRADLAKIQRADEEAFAKELTRDAVLSLDIPLHPAVTALLRNDSLQMALRALARVAPDNRVSKVASRLARVAGDTKVKVVKNLTNEAGKPVAGLFDPQTNTVSIDADAGMNPHVLLHETTHAALSATLANKSHPLTKQLTKLFEDVKPMLDSAYGAKDVDEFASEAMSNPEFQAKLAGMFPNGKEVSAFQRFANSVANFVRRLIGLQTKPLGSALSEADRMIEAMLAPAPMYRDAVSLPMTSAIPDVRARLKDLGDTRKKLGPLTQGARDSFVGGVQDFFQGYSGVLPTIKRVYLSLLGSQALGDVAKKVGLGDIGLRLHDLIERQRGAMNTSDKYVQEQVRAVETWSRKAGFERNQALQRLIYDRDYGATIWQVDPTLTETQARKKYDTEKFAVWKMQRDDWKSIGKSGQEAYVTMRDLYKEQYKKIKDVIYGQIDAAMEDPNAAKQLKQEVYAKLFDSGTLDVYFPLLREGRYKLEYSLKDSSVAREADAYVVERFDSFSERERAVAALKQDDNVVASSIKTHDGDYEMKQFESAPPTSFVKQTLQTLSANNVPGDVQKEILRLFVDALPESSFAKSLQKRKGTPGHIRDPIYAMKTKGYDLGRQAVRLEYGAKIQQLADEIDASTPEETGGPASAPGRVMGEIPAEQVKAELKARAKFARAGADNKQREGVYKRLNQVAFIFTIGFNAASALVNLSQIPLFVLPMLGGKYGFENTEAEIFRAMRLVAGSRIGADSSSVMGKIIDKASIAYGIDAYYEITANGDYKVRTDLGLDKDTTTELERAAPLVKMAAERGQLNRSFLLDALGLEEGGRVQRGNVFLRNMDKISGISAMLFNQAERLNRQVTLLASYNLALDKIRKENPKMSKQEAQQKAAEEALYETQQTNGGSVLETAPRVSQQGLGRVAFMYKSYGLQMYYTMAKTAKEMVDAHIQGDKATRNRAFKQVMGYHGSALFFSGVYGLPLYGAVQMMMDALFFEDDEDDFNTLVRKQIGEVWFKGPLQELTGLNVADRVRLSGLLIQENRYNNNASLEEDIMFYVGGPALSVGNRLKRAGEDFANGDYQRGIENAMPAGVANAYKTTFGRYQQEGGIYTRRGDPMYADMSSWEMLAQGLGFAPAEYAFRQEQTQRDKRVERAIVDKRTNLMRRYYVALRMGDFKEENDVMEEMDDFNRRHPDSAIDNNDLKKSLKAHERTSSEMYNGVTINPLVRLAIEQSRSEYSK